ncbi:MAG: biotin--[acetyl-CoA-carboxylase] ligase, partial [Candidatus Omnitrophota bacterium]
MNSRGPLPALDFLRQRDGFVSGEEISHQLNISRSAVWKQINQLRREGYDIAAVPHLGYRLDGVPDKLLPQEIKYHLGTKIAGKNILYYETIGSTMDEAFRLGVNGAPEGTVVLAEAQARGRGRMRRSWVSPPQKGIYLSLLLRPRLSPQQAPQITLMTAVSLAQAIKSSLGIEARIKWPNDILVRGNKVAGILTEIDAEADEIKFVVIGWGINTHINRPSLPPQATSLHLEATTPVSRLALARETLRRIDTNYGCLQQNGFGPMRRQWKEMTVSLGQRIKL